MIEFRILKKSKKSRARLGILKTPHGEVETPAFVPVATNAALKALTSEEALRASSQILIVNTFHLHVKGAESAIKSAGGLHKFMNWPRPLMTDSGGFQVFSLGFGKDLKVGKLLKTFPGRKEEIIDERKSPSAVRLTLEGVIFRSPLDGHEIFLGPKESISIQEKLGADIMFAFDECTAPLVSYEYAKHSLSRTHRWAKICLESRKSTQGLFGIVQGSHFKDLRIESARYISSLGFDGYGIGGDLGKTKGDMIRILQWVVPHLDEQKPRHLLGIGHLEDMEGIVRAGMDLFDCNVATHYARHGVAFTSEGRLDLRKKKFLKDRKPLDPACDCEVCGSYCRSYISHLLRAGEITAIRHLTFHNLFYFNEYVKKIREKINKGVL